MFTTIQLWSGTNSKAGLEQGMYQIFGWVINRGGKIEDFGHK